MASIRERTSSKGETTYAVLYREGKRQRSDTFSTAKGAARFKALLDVLGPEKARAEMFGARPESSVLTVEQLAQAFLEWKQRDVTERTISDYRRDYQNWIRPTFGAMAADEVTEVDVQRWVDEMAKTLSPKTVADRHMVLHSMYAFGRKKTRGLVTQNPCQETDLPEAGKKKVKGTTVPEWLRILAAADELNPDAGDLIRFLGTVGWRFSEAIALPVENVDQREDGVWVNMTQVFRIVENRQVLAPDSAKSWAGFRNVEIISDETAEMVLRRCAGKGPKDFVFTTARGERWNQNSFLRETWPRLLTAAELWRGPGKSPTPHWLRHMAVAVLLASGVTYEEVRRYVGHESLDTTLGTYGGMVGGFGDSVRDRANRILRGEALRGVVVTGDVVRELD